MDELARAQQALGRALGRARAGEDRELAQKVREGGEQLAHMLNGLLKLTRTHAPDNRAFDAPVAEFGRALASLGDLLGTVHLVTVEDQVYVNDIRVRGEVRGGQKDLGSELRRHNTGGLSFHAALEPEQIRALVAGLAGAAAASAPRRSLGDWLAQHGAASVELSGIYRFRAVRSDGDAPRRDPGEVLAQLLLQVEETFQNVAAGRVLNPLPLRRSVIEALEAGLSAPAFWLGFPDCPPHAAHAVQVALVALVLGKEAGLPAGFLQDLGISALVHDAGYLAPEVGEGPAALGRHSVQGARIVLRQRGFSEAKLRRLRAVLEHHRDFADPAQRPSTMGSILRLAEDYTNVIRLYGAKVTRPDALGAMLKAGGRLYHPALAQLLVNALGRYPPGTLLELGDGTLARSTAPARGADLWDRPLVRRLDPATRQPTGALLDLAAGGQVRRALPG
ncbi:MAG: hypothetical protein IPO09_15990 [Anaeromyxobacter sp.]|nr:hypothetical protein [Anaeromyxobacter sp.]MBL0276139.1 hypothetical protein [Anaeromyxobacter sp.]